MTESSIMTRLERIVESRAYSYRMRKINWGRVRCSPEYSLGELAETLRLVSPEQLAQLDPKQLSDAILA
jgi:hypothetical protein